MSRSAKAAKQPSADVPARAPGRPRSEKAHQAILGAALGLLVENGFSGLSMEAVAARSGTSKATVYRRWPSKFELAVEALDLIGDVPTEAPDTGGARDDYLVLTQQFLAAADPRLVSLMPRLMTDAADSAELFRAVTDNLVAPRRAILATILRRGIERGELREDLDVELAIDLLIGPLIYRAILSGADLTPIRALSPRVWDAVIEGIGPDAGPATASAGRR